jgi:hypothetical protein
LSSSARNPRPFAGENAQHVEEFPGNPRRRDLLGIAPSRQVEDFRGERCYRAKRAVALLHLLKPRHRKRSLAHVGATLAARIDQHQAVRLPVRQRAQQKRVGHRKYRSVGADSYRQRQHRRGGKPRRALKYPQREANILGQIAH